MSRQDLSRSFIGRAAAAVRQHFADPTFYARRYRASVGAPESARPPRRPTMASRPLWAWTWWLSRRQGSDDGRLKVPPSALDRWMVRPVVFLPATLIGLAVAAATADVSRDAPLPQELPFVGGLFVAWLGLGEAAACVAGRWPRVEPVLMVAWGLLGIAAIVTGIALMKDAAIGSLLAQAGLWTIVSLVVAWWKNHPGQGES